MSFNICSLSGNIIEEPVVSKLTGHIYEKRIIEKYITNFGKCPMTSASMKLEDLLKVNTEIFNRPKLTKENSLPGLFSELQNQMENVLAETSELKQKVDSGREELTHSLYQYDASLRVISKLIKERDSILQEINNLKDEFDDLDTEAYVIEEKDYCGIYQSLGDRITELSMMLSQMRKERKMPENYPNIRASSKNHVKTFKFYNSFAREKQGKKDEENKLRLTGFDLNKYFDNPAYFLTGYSDGNVILSSFDINGLKEELENENINNVESLESKYFKDVFHYKSHKSEITALEFYPSETNFGFVVCSKDNHASFIIGNMEEKTPKFSERYRINSHMKTITSCSFHPLKEYAAFGSMDNYWSFHNILKGVTILKKESDSAINAIKFHPDGIIFGTGHNQGEICLWDITSQEIVANFESEEHDNISQISFSENGYYFISSSKNNNIVNLWDLRKQKVIRKIEIPNKNSIDHAEFDNFGNYIGISANSPYIYNVKSAELITDFDNNKSSTFVKFDREMEFIMSVSNQGEIYSDLIFNN